MNDYNISAGRTPAQIAKMKKLQNGNICAFCPEHFDEFHDNPVELSTQYWLVTKNDYPYAHTSTHLLIIPHQHVSTLEELSSEARAEFLQVITMVEKQFQLISYGLAMRVGDMRYNGGSVKHMHAHILVGDVTNSAQHEPVRFKFSSMPKS